MKIFLWWIGCVLVALGISGCEFSSDSSVTKTENAAEASTESSSSQKTSESSTTESSSTANEQPQASVPSPDLAFGSIVWLDPNISGWPATSELRASVSGGTVYLNHSKARVWPARDGLNANAWAFVNRGGTWYAATWEYLRFGQTAKSAASVEGGHFKKSELAGYRPQSGEVIGLMVSGLVRGGLRNVSERSNVVMVTWP